MDQMESIYNENTECVNNILLKHDELLLAYTSDTKRVNEKINVEFDKFREDYKRKCFELEVKSKFLQQRDDELKKIECKILEDKKNLCLKNRKLLSVVYHKRERSSCCKKSINKGCSSREEADDLKRELDMLKKRTAELEEQAKGESFESLQNEITKLKNDLRKVDEDYVGLQEKLKNFEAKLTEKRVELRELKDLEAVQTLVIERRYTELQDARQELIDGLKTNPNSANIGVKNLGEVNEGNEYNKSVKHPVQELWNNKEKRKASLKEGVEYIIKRWKVHKLGLKRR